MATLKAEFLPINNEETLNAQGGKAYFYIHAVKDEVGKLINQADGGPLLDSLWVKFVNRYRTLSSEDMNQVLHFLHCLEEVKQMEKLRYEGLEEQANG